MHAGIALRPGTPVECVFPYVDAGDCDMVLPLSVEPGFGGQPFQPAVMSKVRALRSRYRHLNIEVAASLLVSPVRLDPAPMGVGVQCT